MFLCVKDGNIFFQRLIFRDDINDLPADIDSETNRCCELQESDNYFRHAWLPAKCGKVKALRTSEKSRIL